MAEMYYNKAYTTPDNQSIDQKYLYSSECPDGYFGKNCSSECRPPTYGTLCQKSCDCLNSACHFIHGCTFATGKKTSLAFSKHQYLNVHLYIQLRVIELEQSVKILIVI